MQVGPTAYRSFSFSLLLRVVVVFRDQAPIDCVLEILQTGRRHFVLCSSFLETRAGKLRA